VTNGRPSRNLIHGVPQTIFFQMSYTAIGGSGCAITIEFGSTYPNTTDGCGSSGMARLRSALSADARAFP
jgi:hypothetical protein